MRSTSGSRSLSIRFAFSIVGLVFASAAAALPFSTDISVTSRNWFDVGFATGELSGSGTQTGTMSLTSGGVTTTSAYIDAAVGANPLTGAPTDIGDGLGLGGTSSATDPGTFGVGIGSPTDPLQTFLRFVNNSATASYHVSLAISLLNLVDSTGADAYAHSALSLKQDGTEFFFSDITSDTVNGNSAGGGFGGPVSESVSTSFGFDLAPGANTRISADWTLRGGAFAATSSSSSNLSGAVTIAGVRSLAPPPPPALPIPGTLALLVPSLIGLGWVRARRAR